MNSAPDQRSNREVAGRHGSHEPVVVAARRRAPRSLGPLMLVLGAALVAAAGVAQAAGASSSRSRAWRIERTRDPARAEIGVLASVACVSETVCTAVGSSAASPSSPSRPLAERWQGGRWRIQSTPAAKRAPSDVLFGVACPSARACVAVGNGYDNALRRMTTLAELWNGRHWRVQATPTIRSQASLNSVSCESRRSCVAVGYSHDSAGNPQALVERWNGRRWRIQSTPRLAGGTQLLGVSCAGARACTAVGDQSKGTGSARPLVESWNGARWRVRTLRLPHAGILSAVSCTSARACTATGSSFDVGGESLAERWNGRTWRVQPTPNPTDYRGSFGAVELDGVSCTSARACVASGEYSPDGAAAYFLESWNGSRWRLLTVPHPAGFEHGALLGVSCAAGRCEAVGAYTGRVRLQVTLAMAD